MIFEKQVLNAYRAMAYTRCDDTGVAYYFSIKDFPGLLSEEYDFISSRGDTLRGYLYYYENPTPARLVVFDHGFGGGHLSYMKEIELLARRGYLVFAYDHTGCMRSGGESPNGMAQSLCDLNDAILQIKSDGRFSGFDISVVGHSWGGFSTMNISALHPEISHVAVISGFVSVELLISSYFGGLMKGYRRAVMALEREANPYFVNFSGIESLKNSSAKALLIYSADDKMCKKNPHYDRLAAELSDRPDTELLLLDGRGHNPNYTADAVGYLGEYLKERARLLKRGGLSTKEERERFVASFDWDRMTAQDGAVWQKIFAFLES